MKYNHGKIKREHGIMKEFMPVLKKLATHQTVKRIIPGRIARSQQGSSHFTFSVSYKTTGGYKCVMKKGGTSQELFLLGYPNTLRGGEKCQVSLLTLHDALESLSSVKGLTLKLEKRSSSIDLDS